MNNLKIVLIDDEPSARKTLRLLINKLSKNHEIVAEIDSVSQANSDIPSLTFDVLLLDIKLIDGTGFDILEAFPKLGAKVIFTTAFDDYAIKAFKENAIDYLLKPINLDELKRALAKCNPKALINYDYNELIDAIKTDLAATKIAIKGTEETIFILSKDIDFIRADGSYCTIYCCEGKTIFSSRPLKHYEDLLCNSHFFKINRQEIINNDQITVFKKNIGHGQVIMRNGDRLNISRRKIVEFNNWIKEF